jgi:hypothetical protein
MTQRIEADETGLAERISRAFSLIITTCFCLGCILAPKPLASKGAAAPIATPRAQIRRHATVLGIPPALWEPLATAPHRAEQPGEVLARYRNGLTALVATLSSAPPAK